MKEDNKQQALRELCLGVDIFPEEVLTWIAVENLWNIWVPKKYGGLEFTLTGPKSKAFTPTPKNTLLFCLPTYQRFFSKKTSSTGVSRLRAAVPYSDFSCV